MTNATSSNRSRLWKPALLTLLGLSAGAGALFYLSEDVRQFVAVEGLDAIGSAAEDRMADAAQTSGEAGNVAAEFIETPIIAREIAPDVWQATGVGNTHLISTSAGQVLFDTGLSTQAGKQYKALEEALGEIDLSHIILSHSHADHSGGPKLWLRSGVDVVTHEEFVEEQRYLTELQGYFWHRNRTLFPFMPEEPPTMDLIAYGGIEPTIEVDNDEPLSIEQGGVTMQVLALPGAEGADNLVLWLPEQRILFSGDFFGPIFPQFPNVFTMRGEKIRKPIEYIASLETVIALDPLMIVPSHKDPITDQAVIREGLVKMRDAVRFVHDATIAAMNDGKTVEQAMRDIALPAELALTQEHGRVSWAVKSIWEYYATWFHFDRTTELYPVAASEVYGDIVELAGGEALTQRARSLLDAGEPVKALHLIDIVLEGGDDTPALEVRRDALMELKQRAQATTRNSYELYWLDYRLRDTEERLAP